MKKLLKSIYEALPFKLAIYKVVRKLVKLPKKLHAYFYFKGVFQTRIEDKTFLMQNYGYQFHVENELFWGGIENGWEKSSTALWVALCKNSSSILDIGANTGFYSVLAKTLEPNCVVHAFEPLPAVHEKLVRNNTLNNYDIVCSTYALSNFNGTASVYPTSLDHVYSVTVNKNLYEDKKTFEIKIKTKLLKEYIEENNIKHIDLMKIDVETHEVEVLQGMGEYLKKFQPDMLIEIQNDEIATGVTKLIEGIDYVFFNIDEVTGIQQVTHLQKSATLNFLVCKRSTANRLKLL